jgi:glycosyltransferase involved in cell wall biosynthesis
MHGIDAEVVLWSAPPFAHGRGRVLGRTRRGAFAALAPFRRDVLHYQYGSTWAKTADAYWARLLRRTLICTFHGDDCRLHSVARERFPARARVVDPSTEPRARRRLRLLGPALDAALVADRELATYVAPFVRRVYVTPLPLHDDPAADEPPRAAEPPIVLHAASDPLVKGTEIVVSAAAEAARREPFELLVLAGRSHADVARALRSATVVVDQLNSVTSGVFALEAMRVGVPVLGEYDPAALAPYQAELPVVRVDASTLADELAALLASAERRAELSARGGDYVARTHDPRTVGATVLAIYEHCRSSPPGVYHATAAGICELEPPLG